MKKIFYRILTLILTVTLLVSALSVGSLAASASVHFSDPSVVVGNTVSVNVSVGEAVAYCNIGLSYDSSMLEYTGSSSSSGTGNFSGSGSGGVISLYDYYSSGAGSLSFTLTFKALKSGTTKINVSSYDIVDGNADNMEVTCGYSLVTITNPVTASSDATLKSLSISPGTLSPAFSSGTTSYTTTVSNSTTSVVVSASKNHSGASVSVSGGSSLSVGKNNVNVTVTAENGTQKTYTIVVTRASATVAPPSGGNTTDKPDNKPDNKPEEPEKPKDAYATLTTGEVMKAADEIDKELIPAGFKETETTVETITVPGITYGEGGKIYVYLEGEGDIPSGFYTINSETKLAEPMEKLSQKDTGLILADINTAEPPAGYKLGKAVIGEKEYDVFVPTEKGEHDHCLISAINESGECALYAYDPVDGYFQRFGLTDGIEAPPEPEPVPEPEPAPEEPKKEEESFLDVFFGNKIVFWTSIGLLAVVIILAALSIMLGIMYTRKSRACRLMSSSRARASVMDSVSEE